MAVKSLSLSLTHISITHLRPRLISSRTTLSILRKTHFPKSHLLQPQSFSTTATPYPLQYDLILRRPAPSQTRRQTPKATLSDDPSDSEKPDVELSLDGWVDHKLASEKKIDRPISGIGEMDRPGSGIGRIGDMDRSKRKYYNKRRKRMYGSDSDEDRRSEEGSVELVPEVVEFDRLHKREEELYFYDAFAYPWEKDKHYRMVYELEKKYFPDQGMDKAFLEPGASNEDNVGVKGKAKKLTSKYKGGGVGDERLVFFEEEGEEKGKKDLSTSVTEKKYSPDQGMDKAFLEPGASSDEGNVGVRGKLRKLASKYMGGVAGTEKGDERLVFFEEEGEEKGKKDLGTSVAQKKVDEIFTWLEKVPGGDNRMSDGEPYLLTRSRELPSKWDGPFGTVVLVNKPKGWTSFTVCGKLRRLVNVKKVGHAGTLDPMATGLLIVCVGRATKLADTYQGMVKGYSGIFRLGEATSTWDADSPVIQRESWEHIRDEDIRKAVASFLGEIWQVPPMFSAIKVKGEKMYDKARRGESIELAPRRISIFEFDFERSMDDRQDLIFRVVCSKGTYIRSLCSDLGKALGSCAHLTALRRDSIGEYSAEDAWEFSELEEAIAKR